MNEIKADDCLQIKCLAILMACIVFFSLFFYGKVRLQAEDVDFNKEEEPIKLAEKKSFEGEGFERQGMHEEAVRCYEEAVLLYERAMAQDESRFGYLNYSGMAECYLKLGKLEEALNTLRRGVAKMKESNQREGEYHLQIYMANIFRDIGEVDTAIAIYETQVDLGLEDFQWYKGLAGLYQIEGEAERSRDIYRRAYERFFLNPTIYYGDYVAFLINNGYLEEAETVTYAALLLMQGDPDFSALAYRRLLEVYERRNKSEEIILWAREKLEEAEQARETRHNFKKPSEKISNGWLVVLPLIVALFGVFVLVLLLRNLKKEKRREEQS